MEQTMSCKIKKNSIELRRSTFKFNLVKFNGFIVWNGLTLRCHWFVNIFFQNRVCLEMSFGGLKSATSSTVTIGRRATPVSSVADAPTGNCTVSYSNFDRWATASDGRVTWALSELHYCVLETGVQLWGLKLFPVWPASIFGRVVNFLWDSTISSSSSS